MMSGTHHILFPTLVDGVKDLAPYIHSCELHTMASSTHDFHVLQQSPFMSNYCHQLTELATQSG
jgi:hypothetical protein